MGIIKRICEAIVDHGLGDRRAEFIGNRGPQGLPGPQGDKGDLGEPGKDGETGKTGVGLDNVKAIYLIKRTSETEEGSEIAFPKVALVYYDPEKGEDVIHACDFGIFEKESDMYVQSESFSDKAKDILL